MTPTIYLAFVDDWELRGSGAGDVERMQIRPMQELVRIFNNHGIRGSFNAEVMQQLTFRKFQDRHPELKTMADAWDGAVRETFRQGHDIQLHIHPQWRDARYDGAGRWNLVSDWNILNHEPGAAFEMMTASRDYLENLLRPVDPSYACVSFRSGAWCIAPSPHILRLLVRLGIVFDMSIVGGVRYNTKNVQLDYTRCEETFLPYYPNMEDARKVSDKPEEIICVPTNHFYESRLHLLGKHLSKTKEKLRERVRPTGAKSEGGMTESYYQEWAEVDAASTLKRIYKNVIAPYRTGKHFISDIAQLDYSLLSEMLRSIRRRARATGLSRVPVVLENHTKDIHDFSHIERFLGDVAKAPDIRCITLTELARELLGGGFEVRVARAS